MAKGKHPVPFRTRKLSPSAPMVLRGGPRGRVGRRRTSSAEGRYRTGSGPQRICAAEFEFCTLVAKVPGIWEVARDRQYARRPRRSGVGRRKVRRRCTVGYSTVGQYPVGHYTMGWHRWCAVTWPGRGGRRRVVARWLGRGGVRPRWLVAHGDWRTCRRRSALWRREAGRWWAPWRPSRQREHAEYARQRRHGADRAGGRCGCARRKYTWRSRRSCGRPDRARPRWRAAGIGGRGASGPRWTERWTRLVWARCI